MSDWNEYMKKWRAKNQDKVKAANKRYDQSEKGRLRRKRYYDKKKTAPTTTNQKEGV